jgi:hypothetical protein
VINSKEVDCAKFIKDAENKRVKLKINLNGVLSLIEVYKNGKTRKYAK